MNLDQLRAAFKALGVTPKEIYRASLYLRYLWDAERFSRETMKGHGGISLGLEKNPEKILNV